MGHIPTTPFVFCLVAKVHARSLPISIFTLHEHDTADDTCRESGIDPAALPQFPQRFSLFELPRVQTLLCTALLQSCCGHRARDTFGSVLAIELTPKPACDQFAECRES